MIGVVGSYLADSCFLPHLFASVVCSLYDSQCSNTTKKHSDIFLYYIHNLCRIGLQYFVRSFFGLPQCSVRLDRDPRTCPHQAYAFIIDKFPIKQLVSALAQFMSPLFNFINLYSESFQVQKEIKLFCKQSRNGLLKSEALH